MQTMLGATPQASTVCWMPSCEFARSPRRGWVQNELQARPCKWLIEGNVLSAPCCLRTLGTASAATNGQWQAGDVGSYALPARMLGVALWRGGQEGAKQFAAFFAATVVTAEILKRDGCRAD